MELFDIFIIKENYDSIIFERIPSRFKIFRKMC